MVTSAVPVSAWRSTVADKDDLNDLRNGDADMARRDLRDADLAGLDLSNRNFHEAHLEGASARGASFEGANLQGMKTRGMSAPEANFQGVNAERTVFFGMDLHGSSLRAAKLEHFPSRMTREGFP